MPRSTSAAMRRAWRVLVPLVASAPAMPLFAADIGQRFASVDEFVKSMPHGSADVATGYGDLAGAGRRDWGGLVSLQDPQIGSAARIVVLVQQADGSYRVAAQGPVRSTDGGTGHYGIDQVRVQRGSLFVSWSWNWHGCGGGSTQQIKFYRNQWRVIGAEFRKANAVEVPEGGYDAGDSATLSHNLLTGAVVIHVQPVGGDAFTDSFTGKPTVELLDERFEQDSGDVTEFSKYANC